MKMRKDNEMPKSEEAVPYPKWGRGNRSGGKQPRPVPSRQSGNGRNGGIITASAEQVASVISKPAQPIDTLKGMDAYLGDVASAVGALAGGLNNASRGALPESMPDERAVHEGMASIAQRAQQLAQELQLLQADARRRNHQDHERLDNARRNERGYDWQSNNQ